MSEKTVFKRIIDGELPADIVYQDDLCIAIKDINAQAPVHLLVIPRKEIPSIDHITDEDQELIGHLYCTIRNLARDLELTNGYRVIVNCGHDGGQTADHLHFHLMGGRTFGWP